MNLKMLFVLLFCSVQLSAGDSYVDSLRLGIAKTKQSLSYERKCEINSVEKILFYTNYKNIDQYHDDSCRQTVQDYLKTPTDSVDEQCIHTALQQQLYYRYLMSSSHFLTDWAERLQFALDYWKEEFYKEQRAFYKKNFLRWFHTNAYLGKIQRHITDIKKIQSRVYLQLGMVRHSFDTIHAALTEEQFNAACLQSLEVYDFQDDMPLYQKVMKLEDVMIEQLHQYEDDFQNVMQPHHFARNWGKYTVGTVACIATLYFVQKYHDQFAEWQEIGEESVKRFYNDHIEAPVMNVKESFFGDKETKINAPSFAPFNTQDKEKIVDIKPFDTSDVTAQWKDLAEHDLREIAEQKQGWTGLFAWKEITDEEIHAMMHDKELMQTLDTDRLKAWLLSPNAAMRAVVRQALILKKEGLDRANDIIKVLERIDNNLEVNVIKHNINELMEVVRQGVVTLEEERKDQKLNLQIAALFPACVLLYGAWSSLQAGYYAMFQKKLSHDPIRSIMRDLEQMLNVSMNVQHSFEVDGKIYFLLGRLKKAGQILSSDQASLFDEDIIELARKDLTYAQKYNVVQRMYHTYGFLFPGAV